MRGEWFKGLEECYLAALEQARLEFDEVLSEFLEVETALREAEDALAKFRAKYPPDYDGPAPWY